MADAAWQHLPEKVWGRDGKEYEYAERKKPRRATQASPQASEAAV